MMYRCFFLITMTCLISCTTVDNLIIGQDNTPEPSPLQLASSMKPLEKKWSLRVRSNAQGGTNLQAAHRAGLVYTASSRGQLQANNSKGELVWRKKLDTGVTSGPAVYGIYLAVASDNASLSVFDSRNGTPLWSIKLTNLMLAVPVMHDNLLFAKTIDGQLTAYNLLNGKKEWSHKQDSPALILNASSAPALSGNTLVAAFSDGKILGFNALTGQKLWQNTLAYAVGDSDVERMVDIVSTPLIADDTVFAASYQGDVVAMSLAKGEIKWRYGVSTYKNMILSEQRLFVTAGNGALYALNASNGSVLWKQTKLKYRGVTAPIIVNSRLVVSDKFGYLHTLNQESGEFINRTQFARQGGVLSKGTQGDVFVLADDGILSDFKVA